MSTLLTPSFSTPLHWTRGDGVPALDVARFVSVLVVDVVVVAVLDVAVDVVIVTVVAEVAVVVVAEIEVDAGASPQLIARWAFNAELVTP